MKVKPRPAARPKGQPKPVLPRLTDLIFVAVSAYLVLNYVLILLYYVEIPLLIIREAFNTVYLLMAFALLAIRNRAKTYSGRKRDYAYTILGFGSPLLFQVTPQGAGVVIGSALELVGLVFVVSAFLSLNRSFGLAPENRGIKTGGAYSVVRHPMYLGYILAEGGYVIDNFSYFNALIFAISASFLLLRLRAEEQLLQQDRAYRSYARRTQWKLLPFVY